MSRPTDGREQRVCVAQIGAAHGLRGGVHLRSFTKDPQAFANCRQIAMELHHPELTGRPETPVDMILKLQSLGFTTIRQMHDTYYFSH